jgi:hypothetical protein
LAPWLEGHYKQKDLNYWSLLRKGHLLIKSNI